MAESFIRVDKFLGTDNTSDPSKLQPLRDNSIFLREAVNVDIDDEYMLHRRDGYSPTPVVSGNGIHSFWSDNKIALFVQNGTLYRLNDDLTVTPLIYGVDPTDTMVYVSVADRVFFSNTTIVGYIYHGLPYPFPEPNQTFKVKMVGGHILEYYNSRLYAANDRNLMYSDATILTQMDSRKNAIAFPARLTMVKSVINGLYVGTTEGAYFLRGGDPSEFTMMQVLDDGVIYGSAITVADDNIGRGITGKTVYWLTKFGPYKGYPDGVVTQCQRGLFNIDDKVQSATSVLMDRNGYEQYMAVYRTAT